MREGLTTAALLVACLLGAGCKSGKLDQCNRLIDAINPHTKVLSLAVEGLTTVESDPAVVGKLREAADAADADLKSLQFDDAKLAGFALAYRKQLAQAREAGDKLVGAVASEDPAALHEAVKRADAFLAHQDDILADLNDYCGGA